MYGIHIRGNMHHDYGTHHSNDRNEKQSKTMKLKYATREWLPPFKDKKHTLESKLKLSKIRSEKGLSKGKNNTRAKKIICITTGKEFDTMKEGADFYNIKSLGNLSHSIKLNKPCAIS